MQKVLSPLKMQSERTIHSYRYPYSGMEVSCNRSIHLSKKNLCYHNRPVFMVPSHEANKRRNHEIILDALEDIFSDFGIPETIISDSGPCYRSQEFKAFCMKFEIKHVTGS